ncbi:hypothetical protein XENORESO_011476 [Xenotaenia resolanae]|uniref:Uncharacterized protein n=1 Tax=Xenotaenia resolanae TaxID=208358 RepID=A0ABV0W2D4_9TELE
MAAMVKERHGKLQRNGKRKIENTQHSGKERERRMHTQLLTGEISLSQCWVIQFDRMAYFEGPKTVTDCLSSSSGFHNQPYMSKTIKLTCICHPPCLSQRLNLTNRFHEGKQSEEGEEHDVNGKTKLDKDWCHLAGGASHTGTSQNFEYCIKVQYFLPVISESKVVIL